MAIGSIQNSRQNKDFFDEFWEVVVKNGFVQALLLLLLVCFTGTIAAQDIKSVSVNAGPGDPRSIDPQQAIDTRDWYLLNVLFPALTTLDEESNQVEAGIVTGWDISEDGRV